jgi:hypothetical protein
LQAPAPVDPDWAAIETDAHLETVIMARRPMSEKNKTSRVTRHLMETVLKTVRTTIKNVRMHRYVRTRRFSIIVLKALRASPSRRRSLSS